MQALQEKLSPTPAQTRRNAAEPHANTPTAVASPANVNVRRMEDNSANELAYSESSESNRPEEATHRQLQAAPLEGSENESDERDYDVAVGSTEPAPQDSGPQQQLEYTSPPGHHGRPRAATSPFAGSGLQRTPPKGLEISRHWQSGSPEEDEEAEPVLSRKQAEQRAHEDALRRAREEAFRERVALREKHDPRAHLRQPIRQSPGGAPGVPQPLHERPSTAHATRQRNIPPSPGLLASQSTPSAAGAPRPGTARTKAEAQAAHEEALRRAREEAFRERVALREKHEPRAQLRRGGSLPSAIHTAKNREAAAPGGPQAQSPVGSRPMNGSNPQRQNSFGRGGGLARTPPKASGKSASTVFLLMLIAQTCLLAIAPAVPPPTFDDGDDETPMERATRRKEEQRKKREQELAKARAEAFRERQELMRKMRGAGGRPTAAPGPQVGDIAGGSGAYASPPKAQSPKPIEPRPTTAKSGKRSIRRVSRTSPDRAAAATKEGSMPLHRATRSTNTPTSSAGRSQSASAKPAHPQSSVDWLSLERDIEAELGF